MGVLYMTVPTATTVILCANDLLLCCVKYSIPYSLQNIGSISDKIRVSHASASVRLYSGTVVLIPKCQ